MSSFAVTARGFIKGKKKTLREGQAPLFEIEYTDKLMYAQQFASKGKAQKFLELNGLEGFAYSPYEEIHPTERKFEVRQKTFGWDTHDSKVYEYYPSKTWAKDTDVSFLYDRKRKTDGLMTFEEAKQKATELNQAMIDELKEKIAKLQSLTEREV